MAIAAGNAGTWAAVNATTQTVTLPTHAAGTQLILIAACKCATPANLNIQITTPSTGWEKIGSFADGTTGSGNGTGSVTCAVFRRICAGSGETNPVVTWGGSQTSTPGIAVAVGFTKGGSEVWLIPALVQAATNSATSISVTMGSNPGITSGDFGLGIHTTRDDSALTVPTWTATSATLAAVTVFPTTPIASGTSDDMAGTACYRSVTSGTASAAPVVTGTQAAAETGVTSFVRLRVAAANAQAPTAASPTALTITTFAPTVTVPNNKLVTPTTASLAIATFAPTVRTPRLVTPSIASLAIATFAPTVSTPRLVTPATASLTLTTFAPTVTTTNHQRVTPTTASLSLSTFAPTVSAPRLVTPGIAALTLTTFAPTVTAAQGVTVTPTTATLTLSTFAPTVAAPRLVTPTTAALSITTFAPTVSAIANVTVTPSTAVLSLTTFAPSVQAGQGLTIVPPIASLSLSFFAPTLTITQHQRVTPTTAALLITAFAPIVTAGANITVVPAVASLVLVTFAPTVLQGTPPILTGAERVGISIDGVPHEVSIVSSRVAVDIVEGPVEVEVEP